MDTVAETFVETLGLHYESAGMPRIAGRLIGLLLMDGGEHSLDALAALLQVSKASISTNARLLEQRGLVERVARPGDRRDYYRIRAHPWDQLFAFVSERIAGARQIFDAATEALPAGDPARARIADWAAFYAFLLDVLDRHTARWREQHGA